MLCLRLSQERLAQDWFSQVTQDRLTQDRLTQVGLSQVGLAQIWLAQIGLAQIRCVFFSFLSAVFVCLCVFVLLFDWLSLACVCCRLTQDRLAQERQVTQVAQEGRRAPVWRVPQAVLPSMTAHAFFSLALRVLRFCFLPSS